jgi:hypothetical protein
MFIMFMDTIFFFMLVWIDCSAWNMPPRINPMLTTTKSPKAKSNEIGEGSWKNPIEIEDPVEERVLVIQSPVLEEYLPQPIFKDIKASMGT